MEPPPEGGGGGGIMAEMRSMAEPDPPEGSLLGPPACLVPEMPFLRMVNLFARSDIRSPPPDAGFSSWIFFLDSILRSLELRSLDLPPALRIESSRLARPVSDGAETGGGAGAAGTEESPTGAAGGGGGGGGGAPPVGGGGGPGGGGGGGGGGPAGGGGGADGGGGGGGAMSGGGGGGGGPSPPAGPNASPPVSIDGRSGTLGVTEGAMDGPRSAL